MTKKNLSSKG